MKEKILKAIDKGLLNVLSTDIEDKNIDFEHDDINSEYIPYEARTVDMGTNTLWCEYNLGAYPGNKASDWYGDYYAWGETETKDDYSWETYQYCSGTNDTITKYNKKDGLTRLEPKDNVVTQTLGNKFRMPTKEEYEKLIKNTTNEWVENYKGIHGLNGRLFTAENGNALFFPAAGRYDGSERYLASEYGGAWSGSLGSDYHDKPFYLYIYSDGVGIGNFIDRCNGLPVRGVQNKS